VPILFELTEEQIARIAVNQFRLPGVEVVAQLVRHYPQGPHFAHSVGYMGRINEKELKSLDPVNYSGTHHIGKTGIERFYEPELHGQVGYEEVETNARGRVLRVLKRTDPVPGKDIVLSLDIKLQEAAEMAIGGRRDGQKKLATLAPMAFFWRSSLIVAAAARQARLTSSSGAFPALIFFIGK